MNSPKLSILICWKTLAILFLHITILHARNSTSLQDTLTRKKMIVAYLTSSSSMPDPTLLTHINYGHASFKNPKEGTGGINIPNKSFLKDIVNLKKTHPNLKVLLMIGGWGTAFDGFSQMASDSIKMKNFVNVCIQILKEYNLDGIDLDWEYPGISISGIFSTPNDRENFTQLVKQLKKAMGKDKILSIASASNPKYIDFRSCINYLDFVNVMTYDLGNPPYHNAALYASKHALTNAHEIIQNHFLAGVPFQKMNIGIPFYGHGNGKQVDKDVVYKNIPNILANDEYTYNWDDDAKVPFLTNKEGEVIFSYDDIKSVQYKVQYAITYKLGGVMFWEYRHDNNDNSLLKTINQHLKQ